MFLEIDNWFAGAMGNTGAEVFRPEDLGSHNVVLVPLCLE